MTIEFSFVAANERQVRSRCSQSVAPFGTVIGNGAPPIHPSIRPRSPCPPSPAYHSQLERRREWSLCVAVRYIFSGHIRTGENNTLKRSFHGDGIFASVKISTSAFSIHLYSHIMD